MKSFFKYVLATIVGILLSSFLIILIVFGIIGSMISSVGSDEQTVIADNSVLHISLAYPISERTNKNEFSSLNFSGLFDNHIGLNDILIRIDAAKTDDKIKFFMVFHNTTKALCASLLRPRPVTGNWSKLILER